MQLAEKDNFGPGGVFKLPLDQKLQLFEVGAFIMAAQRHPGRKTWKKTAGLDSIWQKLAVLGGFWQVSVGFSGIGRDSAGVGRSRQELKNK